MSRAAGTVFMDEELPICQVSRRLIVARRTPTSATPETPQADGLGLAGNYPASRVLELRLVCFTSVDAPCRQRPYFWSKAFSGTVRTLCPQGWLNFSLSCPRTSAGSPRVGIGRLRLSPNCGPWPSPNPWPVSFGSVPSRTRTIDFRGVSVSGTARASKSGQVICAGCVSYPVQELRAYTSSWA